MKIYDARRSNGRVLPLGIYEKYIWYTTKDKPFLDAMVDIEKIYNVCREFPSRSRFNYNTRIDNNIGNRYKRYDFTTYNNKTINDIVRYNNNWYIKKLNVDNSYNKPNPKSLYWKMLESSNRGNCIMVSNWDKNTTTSEYGYTYDDLSNMLVNKDYNQYIKDNDYILVILQGYMYHMRFNINVYYDYSAKSPYINLPFGNEGNIRPHIDMLSDEIFVTDVLHKDYFHKEYITLWHNLYSSIADNLLCDASSITSATSDNFYNYRNKMLEDNVINRIEPTLRSHIIPKLAYMPNRRILFDSISSKYYVDIDHIYNNSQYLVNIGKIWQLREGEIYGYPILSSRNYDNNNCIQYPSNKRMSAAKKTPMILKSYELGMESIQQYQGYTTLSLINKRDLAVRVSKYGFASIPDTGDNNVHYTLNFRFA